MVSAPTRARRLPISLPAWLLPLIVVTLLAGGVAERRWGLLSRLLPRQRRLCVPWSGGEVFLAVILQQLVLPGTALALLGAGKPSPAEPEKLTITLAVALTTPVWLASVLLLMRVA